MTLIEIIAKNINEKRKNLSIDKISKLADISVSTLWHIMGNQVKDVRLSTIIAIAKALNCTVDDLIKD
ncbi:MAG: helix-turn-helix transcriptional regulator [Candidatus Margulisiibacteriota bacterium]|jgi:DNA-binding Xre family transcriptional regulator